jgi:hypothetical protein
MSFFGPTGLVEVRSDGLDDWEQPATLAHVGYTIVAVTLAERLRKAFDGHLAEHGCATGDPQDPSYAGGFIHCPEAARLWGLLPDGDRIVFG